MKPIAEITYEKQGNWLGVISSLERLPLMVKSSALWGQRKAGERLVKILKGHIDRQDLGWDPLKPTTVSGDPRILVDTETYRNAISTWQKDFIRYVGIKKGINNPNGVDVSMIARIHEFLSFNGGPYRPLWGPSMEEFGPQEWANVVGVAIYNKVKLLRTQGFDINLE